MSVTLRSDTMIAVTRIGSDRFARGLASAARRGKWRANLGEPASTELWGARPTQVELSATCPEGQGDIITTSQPHVAGSSTTVLNALPVNLRPEQCWPRGGVCMCRRPLTRLGPSNKQTTKKGPSRKPAGAQIVVVRLNNP